MVSPLRAMAKILFLVACLMIFSAMFKEAKIGISLSSLRQTEQAPPLKIKKGKGVFTPHPLPRSQKNQPQADGLLFRHYLSGFFP